MFNILERGSTHQHQQVPSLLLYGKRTVHRRLAAAAAALAACKKGAEHTSRNHDSGRLSCLLRTKIGQQPLACRATRARQPSHSGKSQSVLEQSSDGNFQLSRQEVGKIPRLTYVAPFFADNAHLLKLVSWYSWRQKPRNESWHWGLNGPEKVAGEATPLESGENEKFEAAEPTSLAACAIQVLTTPDPWHKIHRTHRFWCSFYEGRLSIGISHPPDEPARPTLPKRVPPREMPGPKTAGVPLNIYLLLTLAHIELNAIDLAWDTIARFSCLELPRAFYEDFARVADDESRHLGWCLQRLEELGYAYGDIPAHSILWEGAQKSAGDLVARLVVVPCSQEARGLDAGPRLVQRLMSASDHVSAAIVKQISEEELAHVAVGAYWFKKICLALEADQAETFQSWLRQLCPDMQSSNLNHRARLSAGLQRHWYDLEVESEADEQSKLHSSSVGHMEAEDLQHILQRLGQVLQTEST